jgi:hypothetical protein
MCGSASNAYNPLAPDWADLACPADYTRPHRATHSDHSPLGIGPSSGLSLIAPRTDGHARSARPLTSAPVECTVTDELLPRLQLPSARLFPPSQRPRPCLTASKHGRTRLHSPPPPPSVGFLGGLLDRPSGSDPGDWTWGGV